MPQRNAKNPIKSGRDIERRGVQFNSLANLHSKPKNPAVLCPDCKAEVPPKPGFRFSTLKCPKCGASMSKKAAQEHETKT